MKRWVNAVTLWAMTVGTAANAFAAGARQDTTGIYVWGFLGLCALIVLVQLVPAMMVVIGAVRGVADVVRRGRKRTAEEEVSVR